MIDGRATWLALEPNPVLAFLYLPENGGAGRTAVLFCPAFGWEEMCSYRGRRVWAQALAGAGYPAATISLPGGGDSGGSPRDPGQLDAWTAAVGDAATWLSGAAGADRVCALGIGLGGLLACRAMANRAPIDDLILWGVPDRGRMWLREMRAYAEMVSSRLPEDQRPDNDHPGSRDYIGYVLGDATAAELEALRLTDLEVPAGAGRRVLLLGRDGLSPDARVREHLMAAGGTVTVEDTDDYSALMVHPQEARAPQATMAKSIAWLAAAGEARVGSRSVGSRSVGRELERPAIELPWDGHTVRETPLWLEGTGGPMFAVLSEGVDAERAPVCAVWLNGGALRHTGPNRSWVEVARRWAARGVPVVRVDLAGIGDSAGEEGHVSNPDLYTPDRTRQTLAVLNQLSERGLPGAFVLGGLCSGAYWSLHAALADPRVAGALMINLYAFFWSHELVAERDTRQSLGALQGRAWRRLVRGQVTIEQVRDAVVSVSPGRLRAGAGHPVERAQAEQIEQVLDTLGDRGTEALMLLSRGEGLYDQLRRQGVLDAGERWPNLVFEEIPSRDHMFRAPWLQRHVHASLDRALERVLARGPRG